MVTYALAALMSVSLMLPLLWAVPDMVEESLPIAGDAPVRLVARHRRGLRRRWWTVPITATA